MKKLKNNEKNSNVSDDMMAFKHDFNNIIFTIGGFIDCNDLEGLKTYYKDLEKDCERVNNSSTLNPELINNPGIYNLLNTKCQKAKSSNIEIELEFFFDLNKLHMPIYDFSRILGILLDNAIEAADLSTEKKLKIMFRDSANSHTQIIKIQNSYKDKNIDINKIFSKGISSKENHSGIGLWEVKQIVNRNPNVSLITKAEKPYFQQTLEIYY